MTEMMCDNWVLPKDYLDLPETSWERLGNWFAAQADIARERQRELAARRECQERAAARVDYISSSPLKVYEYLRRGYNSPESAVAAAAREMELPEFCVLATLQAFHRRRDAAARDARDAVVLQFVRLGFTNADIAERLGIHSNTVSRAISKHLHGALRPCDRARLRKRRTS